MNFLKTLLYNLVTNSIIVMMCMTTANAAELTSNKGVVVSKSELYNTITVLDSDTGTRNTYFIREDTLLKSSDGSITFDDIRVGQVVTLKFSETDTGRELYNYNTVDLDELSEIVPVTVTDTYTIKGKITGTRPKQRTLTILANNTGRRLTLNIPKGTKISFNGRNAEIEDLKKGDVAQFKYIETDTGYILVSDSTAKSSIATSQYDDSNYNNQNAIAATLPSTASNYFIWLLAALSLVGTAFGLGLARKNAS